MKQQPVLSIAYFGHNRRDTAFVRRVQAFIDAGVEVSTFTFRRDGEPREPGPEWQNVDLGHVEHAKFSSRLVLYLKAFRAVFSCRQVVARADVVYARNLDIVLFALVARIIARGFGGRPQRLVYECLDVHVALTRKGPASAILRWIERCVLRASDLLVVSSPGFIRHYFEPLQNYQGPWIWVENKLYLGGKDVPRRGAGSGSSRTNDKITIGLVGIIRCKTTLALLRSLALEIPDRVSIRIAGLVSYFLIPDFDEQIANLDNIEFVGPYEWPDGLARVYKDIDLVWAQELSWSGQNSDWLIPNRIYEASYFGVPSIAIGDSETARIVSERHLGYVIPDCVRRQFCAALFRVLIDRNSNRAAQTCWPGPLAILPPHRLTPCAC